MGDTGHRQVGAGVHENVVGSLVADVAGLVAGPHDEVVLALLQPFQVQAGVPVLQPLHGLEVPLLGIAQGRRQDGRQGQLRPEELTDLPTVRAAHEEAGHLVLTVAEPHLAVPALLERVAQRGQALASLSTRHASLEDVFVSLTGRHLRDE